MRSLLRLLTSLRTAIVLIGLLCFVSMLGTVIPQSREAAEYLRAYPRAGQWILDSGLDDVYHGWLFQALLWLLAASSIVCTATRLRLTRIRLGSRLSLASAAEIASMPVRADWPADRPQPEPAGWQVKPLGEGGELRLRVSGSISLIGGVLTHVGLVIILAGGLWGSFAGVEMAIRGVAGETAVVPPVEEIRVAAASDRLRRQARLIQQQNPADPRLEEIRRQVEAMDARFQAGMASPACRVTFEDLWVEYYKSAGAEPVVKGWNSRVAISGPGGEPASGVVRVNQPLSWGPFTFYQADWSKKYKSVNLHVMKALATDSDSGLVATLTLELGKPYKPDWSNYTFVLIDFLPDFRIMGDQFVSLSDELRNPAGRIVAYGADGKVAGRAWAFSHEMAELGGHSSNLPYRFEVVSAAPIYETGLQVASDPGVPLVWAGCLLMTLGLCLTFYISYYEEWVWVRPDGTVLAAVSGNRPAIMLKPVLERLTAGSTAPAAPPTPPTDATRSEEQA
ncbi:MAG TPA: cytochrome c biogenesis protein ResB [Candidatus Ozemobacteraceae bacterium]|nr:cytochrome c biogenesis protein ResB [Candidatus Ozemobacteraceae bacterium]